MTKVLKGGALMIVEEREARLEELSRSLPVTRRFPLLVEMALDSNLYGMLVHLRSLYLLSCLKCFKPEKCFRFHDGFLQEYADDIVELPNRTPNGKLAAKREVALEFNLVQKCVELIFRGLNMDDGLDEIQLPVIVRVQDGTPNPTVESRPYATSKLHSDILTGEAADSATVIIPVLGDVERTGLDFYEPVLKDTDEFVRTFKDYSETKSFVETARKYDCGMKQGQLYIFDSFCLHQTVKRYGGIRVSVDFRFLFKKKVSSDLQRNASRMVNYVPACEWYTARNRTFLSPRDTFEDAVKRFVVDRAGSPLAVNAGAEFSVLRGGSE